MSEQETAVERQPRMADLSPEYAEIMVLGRVLQASGYFTDIRDHAQAVTKILFGRELGFSPIVSMSGIHIIEGKPALSSNLMAAMIKRSGKYDYRVKQWTNDECVLMFREKVSGKWEEVGEASFTIEDAKRAQVKFHGARGPSGWTKFPKAMLFARALSQGLRTYCPDVSASPLYVPEEMGAEVNEEGDVTQLPASARPVAVTEKPVTFKKPESAAVKNGQGGKLQEGEPPAAAVYPEFPHEETFSPEVEYITVPQQKNFHIQCRKAVPEARYMEADTLVYKWLGDHGYRDKDTLPTAAMIPAAGWIKVREAACEWLSKQ